MLQQLALASAAHLAFSAAWLVTTARHARAARIAGPEITVAVLWTAAWLVTGGRAGPWLAATAGAAAAIAWTVRRIFPDWTPPGQALWAAVLLAAVNFLAYAATAFAALDPSPPALALGVTLLFFQAGALALLLIHTFETVDVLCRTHWRRTVRRYRRDRQGVLQGTAVPPFRRAASPVVSLHVPTYNEPPDLVIATLDALARLDYPNYEVIVVDNNTRDERRWRPVEEHCARLGGRFRFFHVRPLAGYKAGALNFALRHTAPDAEVVGVVDADYQVAPNYLRDLVGLFAEPAIGFVQTPQDYRDGNARGRYGRALYLAYQYFFSMSMASRNERNAIIYAGTMGLIRRRALEAVGGWNEWCITEDAELSLRLLDAGWDSRYVDRSYGRGIMPVDYAGLRRQRFRWAFGGMQILRLHWRKLVGVDAGRLTRAQGMFYLTGWFQWLNDALALGFAVLLLIGAAAILAGAGLVVQPLAGATIAIPVFFVVFAVLRFLWGFRVRSGCTWRESVDAFTILLGLTGVVSLACVRGMTARRGVFLRTPKTATAPSLADAARIVRWELLLGGACLTAAAAVILSDVPAPVRFLGATLLTWKTITFWSAAQASLWDWRTRAYLTAEGATPPVACR